MRQFTRVIGAGADDRIPATGQVIFVFSTTGNILVRAHSENNNLDEEVLMGNRHKHKTPRPFNDIFIRNPGAAAVTLTIFLGFGDFDAPLSEVAASPGDTLTTVSDATAGAGAAQIIAANTARRRVTVTALAGNSQRVRVGDSNVSATRGQQLAPGMGFTFETTAALFLIREAAGTVDVCITEEAE